MKRCIFSLVMMLLITTFAMAQLPEIEMVFVKGGSFTMGCTNSQADECPNDEIPAHLVTLSDFKIAKYEVTQALWKAVMGENPSADKGDNKPVEYVNYWDAITFINKLNAMTGKHYRLPTEAEWEYAARGGQLSRQKKYSGSDKIEDVAWYMDNSNKKLSPVGMKEPNELGLYDMSGNVREWCSDYPDFYELSESGNIVNPKGGLLDQYGPTESIFHIVRGGCATSSYDKCRVSARGQIQEIMRLDFVGFRLVLDE